ncbi:MAG: hypothetical protein DWQ35_00380 [Planctomycetota bacterium]|nr:MAG: hypothetical protein DWQ35_00380 [Planctomycetota bacterium]
MTRQSPSGPKRPVVRVLETEEDLTFAANLPFAAVVAGRIDMFPGGGVIDVRSSIAGQFAGADPLNSIRYDLVALELSASGVPTGTEVRAPGRGTTENDTTEIITVPYLRTLRVGPGPWRIELQVRVIGTDFSILAASLPNGNHALLEMYVSAFFEELETLESDV